MNQVNVDDLISSGEAISTALINFTAFGLALLFYYVPPLRRWHEGLSEGWKPGVFAAGQGLVAVVLGILSFTGVYEAVSPNVSGILVLLLAWIFSLATNQGTYQTLIRPRKAA